MLLSGWILVSPTGPITGLALATATTVVQAKIELHAIFICVSWPVGDNAHPGGFLCFVLPATIIFGRDAGGAVTDDLLGGHQVILVDQVADISPAEIVPAEMLQARLYSCSEYNILVEPRISERSSVLRLCSSARRVIRSTSRPMIS
jgi:hypothetical protein